MKLLEPKFIGLVNHYEERFIVGGFSLFDAFRILRIQDLIELEIIVVMHEG
jgi:hypothetical protein